MSGARLQFPFVTRAPQLGAAGLAPMLPLTLTATKSVAVSGGPSTQCNGSQGFHRH